MSANVRIVERRPTVAEYIELTGAVGWSDYVTPETAQVALASSLFVIVAEQGGSAVGMGRIVGDGALYFYLQDVIVTPALQGRGLGDTIMGHLMRWLEGAAPDRAFVGLFSAAGKAPFYERHGFRTREPGRPGMSQYVRMPE